MTSQPGIRRPQAAPQRPAQPTIQQPPAPQPQQQTQTPQRIIAWDTRRTSATAVVGFIFSVLWIFGIGSLVGLILSWSSRSETKNGMVKGDGLAVAGMTLGFLGVLPWILFLVIGLGGWNPFSSPTPAPTFPSSYSSSYGGY